MSGPAVVACTWNVPASDAEELLTLGRNVAEALGGELRWLVLGALPDDAQGTRREVRRGRNRSHRGCEAR